MSGTLYPSLRAKRSNPVRYRQLGFLRRSAPRNEDGLLRGVQRFAEHRIIGVALGAAAIERRLVRRVERRAASESLDQIGIGDERLSERDQVGLVGRERLGGQREIIAIVGDIGALEAFAQRTVVERRDVARAAGGALDDMDVDEFLRIEMIDDVIEQRL